MSLAPQPRTAETINAERRTPNAERQTVSLAGPNVDRMLPFEHADSIDVGGIGNQDTFFAYQLLGSRVVDEKKLHLNISPAMRILSELGGWYAPLPIRQVRPGTSPAFRT